MSTHREPSLPDVVDAVLAALAARYRVTVDEAPDRARALDPPPPAGVVRVVRLVPDGTEGESLTVVLTATDRVAVHVRRRRVLDLATTAPELEGRLLALATELGWARR